MWHAVVQFYGIRPLGRGAPPEPGLGPEQFYGIRPLGRGAPPEPGLGPEPVRDLAREIHRSTQEMHTARPSDGLCSSESSMRRSCARLVPSST